MAINLLIGCLEPAWGVVLRDRVAAEMRGECEAVVCAVDAVFDQASTSRPDVVLFERRGSPAVGALVSSLGRTTPETRVVLFCDGNGRELINDALASCAAGCIFKSSPPSVFAEAVGAVYRGAPWFSREVLIQVLGVQPSAQEPAGKEGKLTDREREIMALIRAGMSNKEIARRLAISDHTVKTHLHHVYVKLHRSGRYRALLVQPAIPPVPGPFAAAEITGIHS